MAALTESVGKCKEVSVTDVGLIVTLSRPSTKLVLRANPANTAAVEYTFTNTATDALHDGAAKANDAAVLAGGNLYLEPGDSRSRENLNVSYVHIRSASGQTEKVKIETE